MLLNWRRLGTMLVPRSIKETRKGEEGEVGCREVIRQKRKKRRTSGRKGTKVKSESVRNEWVYLDREAVPTLCLGSQKSLSRVYC